MKTTAWYARVSTRHQEQEATIESQIAQVMGYAQQQGYEIPPSYQFIDQAISGDQLARPGLDRRCSTSCIFGILISERISHTVQTECFCIVTAYFDGLVPTIGLLLLTPTLRV